MLTVIIIGIYTCDLVAKTFNSAEALNQVALTGRTGRSGYCNGAAVRSTRAPSSIAEALTSCEDIVRHSNQNDGNNEKMECLEF